MSRVSRSAELRSQVEAAFYAGWRSDRSWSGVAPGTPQRWARRCLEAYRYGRESAARRDEIRAGYGRPALVEWR